MNVLKHWLLQVFIAADQLLNAVLCGWADETLSCHLYRLHAAGKPWGRLMPLVDALFFWQPITEPGAVGHCHQAYLREMARYNFPPAMRDAIAQSRK